MKLISRTLLIVVITLIVAMWTYGLFFASKQVDIQQVLAVAAQKLNNGTELLAPIACLRIY